MCETNMMMNTRQQQILGQIQQVQRASVRALATQFGVSEMTIRRDLDTLEGAGRLMRTHGGCTVVGKIELPAQGFPVYPTSAEKSAIGQLAAGLVEPGQTIMVDSGFTALEVARHLPRDAGISVVTTSLLVAQELFSTPINVILLGGILSKDIPRLYGPLTESLLRGFHVDTLFIGCDGASSMEGFSSTDLHLSSLEQALIRIADRVVVVTESAKFGRRAFARFATPEEVHTIVTDSGLSAEDRRNLEERGVTLLLAEP
ncbi:MAG TPA: DeoR/GlpR family DNA-binding transcription regulator [Armatimonadota bacterium]|jgi:DeoR/GlpR family transcriptional regulator of sugar metabolism